MDTDTEYKFSVKYLNEKEIYVTITSGDKSLNLRSLKDGPMTIDDYIQLATFEFDSNLV